jgi:hypothetical protein
MIMSGPDKDTEITGVQSNQSSGASSGGRRFHRVFFDPSAARFSSRMEETAALDAC